jgi:hypothetical protein
MSKNNDIEHLKSLLSQSRKFVEIASNNAGANYDDPENELYMDSVQYEIFSEARRLITKINMAIGREENKQG